VDFRGGRRKRFTNITTEGQREHFENRSIEKGTTCGFGSRLHSYRKEKLTNTLEVSLSCRSKSYLQGSSVLRRRGGEFLDSKGGMENNRIYERGSKCEKEEKQG